MKPTGCSQHVNTCPCFPKSQEREQSNARLGERQTLSCRKSRGMDGTRVLFSTLKMPKQAGEMAQWLRALAALPEDPGSVPSTHMTAFHLV